MAEQPEEASKPAKVVWRHGVGYENDGVPCEVHCLLLDDNGVQWVFRRADREFQVRLSDTAMEAVFALWQKALWEAPVPARIAESQHVQREGKPGG